MWRSRLQRGRGPSQRCHCRGLFRWPASCDVTSARTFPLNMYIFSGGGYAHGEHEQLDSWLSAAPQQQRRRLGLPDTLFDCCLAAEGSVAFELERCGGMNTCATPTPAPRRRHHLSRPRWKMPGYLSPRLSQRRKEQRGGGRKVSEKHLPTCQVRGQRSQGCHRGGNVRC